MTAILVNRVLVGFGFQGTARVMTLHAIISMRNRAGGGKLLVACLSKMR
jgi:hypothetical protein